MIAELTGKLLRKSPAGLVVDVGGVGFELLAPVSTFRMLPEAGSDVHLYTHLHVKDDALQLFGFATPEERALFLELTSISGIGPKLGLAVLSGLAPDVFHSAVVGEDLALLTSVSGIGKKTAQRIIVELKDRLSGMDVASIGGAEPARERAGDAVLALVALGMTGGAAREAVLRVQRESGCDLCVEDLIMRALRKGR
ncbi:MAG: Holliday junction branch migration protein RuvA [Candidatus Eisenbacteria bacterium]|nr:Holliday junction branch migration protein RuvA [Candidatus Eisenbacteria bacterium]